MFCQPGNTGGDQPPQGYPGRRQGSCKWNMLWRCVAGHQGWPGNRQNRHSCPLKRAPHQNGPAIFRECQNRDGTKPHQTAGPNQPGSGRLAAHPASELKGQHQADHRKNRHETTRHPGPISIQIQHFRQNRRQFELLIGSQQGNTQTKPNSHPITVAARRSMVR